MFLCGTEPEVVVHPAHPAQLHARPANVFHHRIKSVKSCGSCCYRCRSISVGLMWAVYGWASPGMSGFEQACHVGCSATWVHGSVVGVCSVVRKPSCYLGKCGIWCRNTLVRLQKTSLGPSWSGLCLELISLIIPALVLCLSSGALKAWQDPFSFAWVHRASLRCMCTQVISPPKTWSTSRQELQSNELPFLGRQPPNWLLYTPRDFYAGFPMLAVGTLL